MAGEEGTLHASQPLFCSLGWAWDRVEHILSWTPRAPSPTGESPHFFLGPGPWGPPNTSSGGGPRPSPVPHPGQRTAVVTAAASASQSPSAALDVSRDGRGLRQVTVAFWYLLVHGTRFAEGRVCASGMRTGLREPRMEEHLRHR